MVVIWGVQEASCMNYFTFIAYLWALRARKGCLGILIVLLSVVCSQFRVKLVETDVVPPEQVLEGETPIRT